MFKSNNGSNWIADPTSEIKFNINRAVFNTAQTGGTAYFVNHVPPTVQLPANPFTMVHGSNKIRVGQRNHGLSSGDTVRFFSQYWNGQVALNSTASINGIPVGEIFGTYASATISTYQTQQTYPRQVVSDVTLDTYTITVSSLCNLGAAAITGITTTTVGGTDIQGNANILVHAIKPSCSYVNFCSTTVTFTGKILKGFTYDYDANSPTIPYTWFSKQLNINNYNPLDTSAIILADSNFDRIDTSQTVTAGSSTAV